LAAPADACGVQFERRATPRTTAAAIAAMATVEFQFGPMLGGAGIDGDVTTGGALEGATFTTTGACG
jgi:hypothetical protein